jgi:hypothetical protein
MEWKVIRRRPDTSLVACSLCLRVRRGSAWVAPEDVITELDLSLDHVVLIRPPTIT